MMKETAVMAFTNEMIEQLETAAVSLRMDTVRLIDKAGSGHIGGSMSSLDILISLYAFANISPENASAPDRDRIIISIGHVSPAYYCVLAAFGFIDKTELFEKYRQQPGLFEGHPNNLCRGVEWCNGCLGQGLSEGCGEAAALKIKGFLSSKVYVLMGDGEQSKGQIQEAIELAGKEKLSNLTAIVDLNEQQSSGKREDVLNVNIAARYQSAGWTVLTADGNDIRSMLEALETAARCETPVCILAKTTMGKGIPEIEDDWHYHGKVLNSSQVRTALERFEQQLAERAPVRLPFRKWDGVSGRKPADSFPPLNCGTPVLYTPADRIDGRKVCAAVLTDLAKMNPAGSLCVLDCDLAGGLGISGLNGIHPGTLLECGIQEHNAMSTAGGIAAAGIHTFYMGFSVFALGEAFNQLRVIDQNHIPLKVIASHCGTDVGQDGKSHQFIDYIAIANALLGFDLVLPADPNQTDKALRWAAAADHAVITAVPRSVLPVLLSEDGSPVYGGDSPFVYGEAQWIRRGTDAVIISHGIMVHRALQAYEILKGKGISCGILNVSSPKVPDEEKLREAAASGHIIVAEDHNRRSGLGSMLSTYYMEKGISCSLRCMGITQYGISASPEQQMVIQKLTGQDIADAVCGSLER